MCLWLRPLVVSCVRNETEKKRYKRGPRTDVQDLVSHFLRTDTLPCQRIQESVTFVLVRRFFLALHCGLPIFSAVDGPLHDGIDIVVDDLAGPIIIRIILKPCKFPKANSLRDSVDSDIECPSKLICNVGCIWTEDITRFTEQYLGTRVQSLCISSASC